MINNDWHLTNEELKRIFQARQNVMANTRYTTGDPTMDYHRALRELEAKRDRQYNALKATEETIEAFKRLQAETEGKPKGAK